MDTLNIIGGIALALFGGWITIAEIKNLVDEKPDTLGGHRGLLITGIGCIVCGIILIVKHI